MFCLFLGLFSCLPAETTRSRHAGQASDNLYVFCLSEYTNPWLLRHHPAKQTSLSDEKYLKMRLCPRLGSSSGHNAMGGRGGFIILMQADIDSLDADTRLPARADNGFEQHVRGCADDGLVCCTVVAAHDPRFIDQRSLCCTQRLYS